MPKFEFFNNETVKGGTNNQGLVPDVEYKAGEPYELPETSCERWEKRGKGKRVTETLKPVDPKSPPKKTKK